MAALAQLQVNNKVFHRLTEESVNEGHEGVEKSFEKFSEL